MSYREKFMKLRSIAPLVLVLLTSSISYAKDYYVGEIEAEKILTDFPKFTKHQDDVFYSDDQIAELKLIKQPTQVKIYFAQWCHDSQREVPRLIQLFKQVNNNNIDVWLYSLDTAKSDPLGLAKEANIKRTPTIILYQDEKEVGRILEVPRMDWASDITNMLTTSS